MDPVGTTNACSRVVVPKSRMRIVTVQSAIQWRTSSLGFSSFFVEGSTRSFVTVLLRGWVAMNQFQSTIPARLAGEVLNEVDEVVGVQKRASQPVGRRVVGPVNDQRFANDV